MVTVKENFEKEEWFVEVCGDLWRFVF